MIQPEVREVAGVFRGELRWMFGPYPALIPEAGWPSVGILDALCRGMQGRGDWTEGEKLFAAGAAAHVGELVHDCWAVFAEEVRVQHDDGVVCTGRMEGDSSYRLPVEKGMLAALRDPSLPQHPPEFLPFCPGSDRNPLESFGLSACLGISAFGEGDWIELRGDALEQRAAAVVPRLAGMCADYYRELHPEEHLGQRADLYGRLIWPLTLCEGVRAYTEAAANLLAYLDGALAVIRGALPLLRNLARYPLRTVRGAALTCLVLDERVPVSGELIEIAADHFVDRAPAYREAAIELAAERGRNIDWLNGGVNAQARFRYERQLSLLPLIHLPFELCVEPSNRELVSALIRGDAEAARDLLSKRLRRDGRGPQILFQQAMLQRHLGELDAAESLLQEIVRLYPERLDAEFYVEAGVGALARNQLEDAITRLERARVLGPARNRVALILGDAYARAGRHDEAVAAFGEAIAQGHLPSDVLVSRAEVQRLRGQQEGYSRDLAAAAALHPFNPRVVEKVMAGYVEA
ncbi:MAG: tetratricopeptide repeat protein [Gemmatimonadetes bacterium]|uniref:Tetratricopeptide repeat protein n=1 Tax=Candidatus Kutchimonas denitrificans TaxID=3056748 RepID=A0AAE4Z9U5_9BACT|nr:tetratricopeptide repeat protein [Gemmatimonadota bacterium]NIR73495.1 tetratricopeptide repeat protein [Candidatus Kutchimonas denitrificans]NIR99454.1 tetratricopeptide repeat protein [Gemmatimonadota bacterium]NIT65074.1 tetratricopeptide repeat protein [Gemmatimonadota bacterium]NIV23607.1 tetratricopeptide repeat protein [Gemmatimonadota bacterium]